MELHEEDHSFEQREEALLQMKRERAQRLAVKRGLSDTLPASDRPRSSGQGSLRDAIPLRRGRSSTLQSQVSDTVPLRTRSATLGSQSSGIPSPHVDPESPLQASQISTNVSPQVMSSSQSARDQGPVTPTEAQGVAEETEFTEFIQAEPARVP